MALKFPTPPTPPVIDKGDGTTSNAKIDAPNFFQVPFVSDGGVNFENPVQENFEEVEDAEETPTQNQNLGTRQVTTPETMARDAVANGAGALTKRTVTNPQENNSNAPTNRQTVTIPADTDNILSDNERGQAVLREFQEEDRQISGATNDNVRTSSESSSVFKSNFIHGEERGGAFWILTLILAIAVGVFVAKKFLFTDKPKLRTKDLFDDSSNRLKAVSEKISRTENFSPPKPNYPITPAKTVKPVKTPKKDDDDKGKHFEVRV